MGDYNSLGEFIKALGNAEKLLEAKLPDFLKDYGDDFAKEISLRVSSTGNDGDGGTFSAYSKKHAQRKLREGRSPYGKKIDKKNFYFTGTMWDSHNVTGVSPTANGAKAKLDFEGSNKNMSNSALAEIHSDTENRNINKPNQNEVDKFGDMIGEAVGRYLDSIL